MWGVPHPRHLKGGLMLVRQANEAHLSQPQGVLIWIWVRRKETFEGGGGAILVHRCENPRIVCSLGGVVVNLESVVRMAGMNPHGREGNHSGHPPRRSRVDRGAGSLGGREEEVEDNGQGDEDPRE